MNFTIPTHYGKTEDVPLTGRQQLIGQGITGASNVLTALFSSRTGTGIQPSDGSAYYDPTQIPPTPPNYTPLIVGTLLLGGVTVATIFYFRGKK